MTRNLRPKKFFFLKKLFDKMPSLLSIPHEVKHDILKCLNFNQLFSVQHVNKYFKNFVRQYKDDLAKKKFDELGLFYVDNKNNIKDFKLVEPFKFELSQQLEKKWKCAIEDSIPTFLCAFTGMDDYKVEVICLVDALQNSFVIFIRVFRIYFERGK
ncbi:unnamed protein product [Meloidogyne enterolobii]|uniref:Uncharacterized protein n=1 Tax=Meloidogyne enterolobii TaxID=390850 RepID=A0ACB0XTY4_MELEN